MTDWARAACVGAGEEFFPKEKGEHYAEVARAVGPKYCTPCPIRSACLEEALQLWPLPNAGVWAGLTPPQLKKAYRKRKAHRT